MNAGEQPVIGLTDTYKQPGVYTLEIPCPRTRSTATIHIEMTDEVRSDAWHAHLAVSSCQVCLCADIITFTYCRPKQCLWTNSRYRSTCTTTGY
jgi:hypothetical protein